MEIPIEIPSAAFLISCRGRPVRTHSRPCHEPVSRHIQETLKQTLDVADIRELRVTS